MSLNPDERTLVQLQQIKNMDGVMNWLKSRRESRREDTESLSGDNLFRAQGRARELAELLSDIQNSTKILERIRK